MAGRKVFSLFGSIAIDGLSNVKKDLAAFDKNMRETNKRLNAMGRSARKAGKGITKYLTVPLIAAGAAAIKFGADFDQAMTNSIAIMGDVNDAMRKDLEQGARDVAKTTKFSAKEAAEAYFFLASAGLNAAESIAALPKVAEFAQAGNFNLAEATDLLTDAQSALGLSSENIEERMENMADLSDVLVKANTVANGSVKQFSESLTNKAGAALRLLNKDMEEGVAVLAVFADQGVKGADAGTKLHIVLRDLQKAAVNNKQGFIDAGISVFDSTGKMRNMADIVEDLENRLGGMSDEQKRAEFASLGFTDKSIAATQALIGTSEAIREYEKDLRSAGGITEEVANKQMQTFWAQLGLVKDQAIDLALTFNETIGPALVKHVIPALKKLIVVVEEVMAWFGRHENVAIFVGTLVSAVAVMGPLLILFAKFMPILKGAILLYKIMTASQVGLNLAMTANPIGAIVVGIAALIAAGVLLWKNWDTLGEKFEDTWDGIKFHFLNVSSEIMAKYIGFYLAIIKGINAVGKYIPGANKLLDKSIQGLTLLQVKLRAGISGRKIKRAQDEAAIKLSEAAAQKEHILAGIEKSRADAAVKAGEEKKKRTVEQIAADKVATIARINLEEQWTKKLREATGSRLELLEDERAESLSKAQEHEANVADINAFYDLEAAKIRKDSAQKELEDLQSQGNRLEEAKIALVASDIDRSKKTSDLKLAILEQEKSEEIRLAEEAGQDTAVIADIYAQKKLKIEQDAAAEEVKIAAETHKEKIGFAKKVIGFVSQAAGAINAIWKVSQERDLDALDKEAEERRAVVEASIMSEEDKADAIAAIDAEAAEKKKALQRENAIREKANAVFGIGLNTALAVAAALAIGPAGIPLAIVVAALGAVQLGVAIATPLPFADGALVKSSPGRGVLAQVGEGNEDELVLPMKRGATELANNIMGKLSGAGVNIAATVAGKSKEIHTHLHIGTLIADEFGLKQLSKTLNKYTVAEAQRTGE